MFGLLYSLFVGGAHVVKGIQDTIENEEYKQKYCDDNAGTYHDNKMRMRDQKTGRIVSYEKDRRTGEVWLRDSLTCQRIRNITQDETERHYEDERRKYLNGATARTYVQYGKDNHRNDKCRGIRYKDLENGKLYVAREIPGGYYYINGEECYAGTTINCLMDLQTYQYVRPTDRMLAYYAGKLDKIKALYKAIEKANKEKNKNVQKYEKTKNVNQNDLFWYETFLYDHPLNGSDMEELTEKDNNFLVKNGRSLKEYVEL